MYAPPTSRIIALASGFTSYVCFEYDTLASSISSFLFSQMVIRDRIFNICHGIIPGGYPNGLEKP
jgi:hypothetical protein